ncbi:MAG: glycosyltransferase [Promethearchaeota archaeon]
MLLSSDLSEILDDKPEFFRTLDHIVGISEENMYLMNERLEFEGRLVVMLPTYNERKNIQILVPTLLILFDHYKIDGHVVVVDDDSPDGTWNLVEDFSMVDPRVVLVHRTREKNRGTAGIVGFRKALKMGADLVVEMDADFSHDPRYIPIMIGEVMKGNDVVLGSRFVEGGEDHDRTFGRKVTSKISIGIIKALFRTNVKDCNCGFRCFTAAALEEILTQLQTTDYHELLVRAIQNQYRIKEIPVTFKDRVLGKSKLGLRRLLDSMLNLVAMRFPFLLPFKDIFHRY